MSGADVGGSGLRGDERLGGREAQRAVRADALVGEGLDGFDAVEDEWHLHHHVVVDLCQLMPFRHDAFVIGSHHLRGHVAVYDFADLEDVLVKIDVARLFHKRGVGGHPVEHAHVGGFLDFVEVGKFAEAGDIFVLGLWEAFL